MKTRVFAPKPKKVTSHPFKVSNETPFERCAVSEFHTEKIHKQKTDNYLQKELDLYNFMKDIEDEVDKMSVRSEILSIVSKRTHSNSNYSSGEFEAPFKKSSASTPNVERCHNPFSKNFMENEEQEEECFNSKLSKEYKLNFTEN